MILKLLYLGVCIGRFRRIYIDKQIVDKSILRIIESSNLSSKINNPISPAIYILIYQLSVYQYRYNGNDQCIHQDTGV